MTEKLSRNLKILHAALQRGEVVAFPTDTVFGLGADATQPEAVAMLRRLKGRDAQKPLQVLVSCLEQAQELGEFSPQTLQLARAFWPGALTLIVPKKTVAGIAENVCGETVGLRWPKEFLLADYANPIAASSANRGGEPPLTDAAAIVAALDVLAYEAGKSLGQGSASTVIEIKDGTLQILREGSITRQQLEDVWNHSQN